MTTIRFATWNLNCFTNERTRRKIDLLLRHDWDVAMLQEVAPSEFEAFLHRPDWSVFRSEPRVDLERPGRQPRTAILLRSHVTNGVVRELDFPQPNAGCWSVEPHSITAVDCTIGEVSITAISAHPPHAADRDSERRRKRIARKVGTYGVLDRFLATHPNAVLGLDANAWVDGDPFLENAVDRDEEQEFVMRFLRSETEHSHRDALRAWLDDHPEALAEIRDRRPAGPLALTYVRGGNRPTGDRFDLFMVPLRSQVLEIEHNYEDAVAAGSDHALVTMTLELGV